MSGSDAYFLYSDRPGKHQHVSTIYIYDQSTASDGKVRFKSILQHVRNRLGQVVTAHGLVHVERVADRYVEAG